MADIQYLNYGDQQIEQQALLNALSNDVQGYVQNKPWSKKRKEKFMSAYSDLMNKGILGASNNTGQWMIDVNGVVDLDSMDKKDKEMYGEAAYFIQQKMAGLLTKASQEQSKEEEKKNLPLFDNAYFTKELGNYISTKEFGGMPIDTQTDWNSLDKRDPIKGTRGRAERAKILARNLKSYADSLDESKLNFEGSPFENLNDFKTRVNRAIEALNTSDESDDTKALNAIGLRASDWFNDGSGDPVTVTLDDGTQQTTTYGQLAEYNKKIEEDKQKKEQELIKQKYAQKIANSYDGAMRSSSSLIGTDIKKLASKYTNDQNLKKQLSDYSKSQNLDRSQWEEIVGAFQFYNSKGALQNLSRDELNKFERLVSYRGLAPSVLKKLPGVDGFYFDTRTNQVIRPYKKDQQNLLSSQDLLEQYNKQLQNPRQLSEGLQFEDYARIGAALGDVISLGGFWANVGGSIVSLIGDTTADIADDKVSTWEAVKNLGKNLGWTAAGFIPGGKLGKVAEHMLRWGPKLFVALNDYNLLNDESNKNTWNKLTSDRLVKEGLNDEDLKNITYWVRALTGTVNAGKAAARDIKYSRARGTAGQEFTTKDGTKIILSNKDVQEINVAGARKGQKAAEAKFKEKAKKVTGTEHEAAEGTFKFSENGRTGLFKNTRSKLQDQQLQGESKVFRTPKQQRYYDLLLQDRRIGGYGGWRWLGSRGTSSYFDHFNSGFSFKNPLNGIMRKIDPYRNMTPTSSSGTSSSGTSSSGTSKTPRTREVLDNFKATGKVPSPPKHNMTRKEWRKANKKLYNDIDKKRKFTELTPEEGTYQFKDPTGRTHTFKLIQRDDDFLLDVKSSDGSSRQAVLTLDQVKNGVWDNIKQSLNIGLRNDISLPTNIIRTLQGTSYGWLKQGGTIDKQKIQKYKEFIKK